MSRKILLISLFLFSLDNNFAKGGNFGLGIILGEPTGLSCKLWNSRTTALDGAIAWSFGNKNAMHIHIDHLFHNFNLINVSNGSLPVYYGIGGRMRLDEDDNKIGVRIPIGLAYQFADAPLDIFFEIVPLLDLVPSTDFCLNGAIGIRYFF